MAGIFNGLVWLIFWAVTLVFTFGAGVIVFIPYLIFTFAGAKKRRQKAEENLKTVLMPTETITAEAIQTRIFSLWTRRTLVAITNSRMIVIKRGIFGGFKMQDIQWKDLEDAKLKQNVLSGICGSNLYFDHLNIAVGTMDIKGVPNQEATAIYTKAQAEEQAWEEKRRVREIEDVRAASGGTVIHTGAPTGGREAPRSQGGNDMLQQIEDAKKLLDQGVISDAEFQEMKAKIIS